MITVLACGVVLAAGETVALQAPSYSAAGIVNAASNTSGPLAPNSFASIYGTALSWSTRSISPEDLRSGRLPGVLAGVRVLIGSIAAHVYYVSPVQINVLVPALLAPGEFDLTVHRDGVAGPAVRIRLEEVAPNLFQLGADYALATRADGSLATPDAPARPGEIIVLYASGLGRTTPDAIYGELPRTAAWIRRRAELEVWLGGVALDPARILYAGLSPGYAGLYQINIRLPDKLEEAYPELRVSLSGQSSRPRLRLPARPE